MDYSRLLFNKQGLCKLYSSKNCQTRSFAEEIIGVVELESKKIGETHFLVDVNKADLWICVCGHCVRCPCQRLTRPKECLYLPKSNALLRCVPNGLSINMWHIPEALTSSLLSASPSKVKAFKPPAQLYATYSIFRENSANLKNEFHCCVSLRINSWISDTAATSNFCCAYKSKQNLLACFTVKPAGYYLLFLCGLLFLPTQLSTVWHTVSIMPMQDAFMKAKSATSSFFFSFRKNKCISSSITLYFGLPALTLLMF